jgi:hypothetical protein
MFKEIKIRLLLNEIEKFINEFEDEFENNFIVDINDIDKWDIDFEDKSFGIEECCSVSIRESVDKELEKMIKEDDLISKKVKIDNYILYIIM